MNKTANAAALGYGAFALTLWLTSMAPAGWFNQPASDPLVLLLMACLGGCVLAIAGIMQWLRGHPMDALLFLAFAAYWWIDALEQHALSQGMVAPAAPTLLGWYDIAWALLAFCAWIAACRTDVARTLFGLGLWLSLFAYALANWLRFDALTVLGGYLGLVTAVVGIYIAGATVVNDVHGHTMLPLGESSGHASAATRHEPPPPQ